VAHDTVHEIEESLIDDSWGNLSLLGADKKDETAVIKQLMHVLSSEKNEGETVADYNMRILEQAEKTVSPLIIK